MQDSRHARTAIGAFIVAVLAGGLGPAQALTYTLSAKAALNDWAGDNRTVPVTVELRGGTPLTATVLLDASGSFSVSNVAYGTYGVWVKPSHWLAQQLTNVSITSNKTIFQPIYFPNGDLDGDNGVDAADVSALLAAADGVSGTAGYNAQGDLDGDGKVSSTDLSIVLANMDQAGVARPAPTGDNITYLVSTATAGNCTGSGPLGMDFDINATQVLQVTQLGVYDDGQNGLNRTITACIYNRDTQQMLTSLTFTPANPGTLIDGSRFLPLAAPVYLPPGFHGAIVAENYGPEEKAANASLPGVTKSWSTNTAGGLIAFTGTSRYGGTPGQFPATVDNGSANNYAAGTFKFAMPAYQRSVKESQFGAAGNGTTDDRTAIQNCINDVNSHGGGIVYFPAGTYRVTIDTTTKLALKIYTNIVFQGHSAADTTIKLANSQGNYYAMLGNTSNSYDLSNVKLYDLTLDGNNLNNPVNGPSDFNGGCSRFALRVYVGHGLRVQRCTFANMSNGNTLTFNGIAYDIVVSDDNFTGTGGGSTWWDHSSIYTSAHDVQVYNCNFFSRAGAGTNGAVTAIEIHGSNQACRNNYISGYSCGFNVSGTGISTTSDNQTYDHNTVEQCKSGFWLWSYYDNATLQIPSPALSNVWITNNTVRINADGWTGVYGASIGIGTEGNSNSPFQGIHIEDNTITYAASVVGTGTNDKYCSGVQLMTVGAPTNSMSNVTILRNSISGSLGPAMYLNMYLNNATVDNNTITNPGSTPLSGGFSWPGWYSGILVYSGTYNIYVRNDTFIDTRIPAVMKELLQAGNEITGDAVSGPHTKIISSGTYVPDMIRETGHTGSWTLY